MALERDIDLLTVQPLLALLPREALRLIAFAAEARIFRAGDVLFRKGDAADGGYLIVSGKVALDGRDDGSSGADIAGAGSLLGEMALFSATIRPATAVAREAVTAMKLPRALMMRVLTEFPDGAARIHQTIADRLTAFSDGLVPVRTALTQVDA